MIVKKSLPFIATALIAGLVGYWIKPNSAPAKDCNSVVMNFSDSPVYETIEGGILYQMASNYRAMRSQSAAYVNNSFTRDSTKGVGIADANSVWFGLEDLKRFIWEIESKVCAWKESCPQTPSLGLGIRIYYGRYIPTGIYDTTSNQYFAKLPPEYENMHTVFMVPTFDIENSGGNVKTSHKDFFLNLDLDPATCMPQIVPTVERTFRGGIAVLLPTGKNHGDLCPPICNARDAAFGR